MRFAFIIGPLAGLLLGQIGSPAASWGATFPAVSFADMVADAEVIVQGRVVRTESVWNKDTSTLARVEQEKTTQAPAVPPSGGKQSEGANAPAPPSEVRTEGGRMIFTRVTLETIEPIKGVAGREVEFFVAGGTRDGQTAIVPGMPEFQTGETYVLFLRSGYLRAADPIVGVNQGFFHVTDHPTSGLPVLLNAEDDYVNSIENGQITLQRNPQATASPHRPLSVLTTPPTPERPGVQSQASPEVQRYWNPSTPPMTVSEFVRAIQSNLGR